MSRLAEDPRRSRILIVDDDDAVRETLAALLEEEFDVAHAARGSDALEAVGRGDVDLVLLDVGLPDLHGLEVCRRIRARGDPVFLPILLLTALCAQTDRNDGLRAGADDFLCKPVDPQELILRVRTFARLRQHERSAREQLEVLRKVEGRLQRRERELATILDHTPDAIARLDLDLRHVFVNERMVLTAGLPRERFLGRTMGEAGLPADMCAAWEEALRLARTTGRPQALEFTWSTACGLRHHEGRVVPELGPDGRLEFLLTSSTDVTQRREIELALREQEERLRRARKFDTLGRFAGGIAHDFNNVLTAILGFSASAEKKLQARGGDWSEPRADLLEVRRAAERAATLTRQLLTFGRTRPTVAAALDVKRELADLEPMLRRLLPEQIDLVTSVSERCSIFADVSDLNQLIMNLVLNARDAIGDACGRIEVCAEPLELDEASALDVGLAPGGYVRLRMVDDGCGMSSEVQARLFEPFFTTKPQGHGLGLATVRAVVEQLGGQLRVISSVGEGTRVEVLLPRAGPAEAEVEQPAGEPALARSHGTVLLVEDDPGVRLLTRRILEDCGYLVLEARDGAEALLIAEQVPRQLDLVLSDVVLPRVGGLELKERLGRTHPAARFLFMSGYPHQATAEAAPCLQKPFTAQTLVAALVSVTGQDRAGEGPRAGAW